MALIENQACLAKIENSPVLTPSRPSRSTPLGAPCRGRGKPVEDKGIPAGHKQKLRPRFGGGGGEGLFCSGPQNLALAQFSCSIMVDEGSAQLVSQN